ncbi:transcription termination factor Rho [Cyclonatronum proteinivorum]|uniref:Transcription termination factor Rho n=1 Tax=Cyclonatronum proteinivorum TaxID=1457365 RepID=A0A345UIA1_9BACT|nr:transcription termination factor Rho [Cyclonatronum proteinivorum]AXJ00203.1 transcription termination factor Rho [Cyclonatronum proteinivorum]
MAQSRKKSKSRGRRKSNKPKGRAAAPKGKKNNPLIPEFNGQQPSKPAGTYSGVLEINEKGYGFLRKLNHEFTQKESDPFVHVNMVHMLYLKPGLVLDCELEEDNKGNRRVTEILQINGRPIKDWTLAKRFELQTPIMPVSQIKLSHKAEETEMRVIDLISPVGKGQRAIIVAPPRTGKTVLLKQIAKAIETYHKKIHLAVLLIDERPEEVTDFIRTTSGQVFASSNDNPVESHTRIAEMALGYVKRRAEMGDDVVLLIDSLTRMGRAYNGVKSGSGGRTMSGGLDIRALEIPKRIFGAARKIEGAGSLTIIATCLIETNSRMDDLIFEEFKGTGNMELVLDRDLANDRIFPAINIAASGTRNEEKFIEDSSIEERNVLRRYLLRKPPKDSMLSLLQVLKRTTSNRDLLEQLATLT